MGGGTRGAGEGETYRPGTSAPRPVRLGRGGSTQGKRGVRAWGKMMSRVLIVMLAWWLSAGAVHAAGSTFSSPYRLSLAWRATYDVAIGDVNGDGRKDLVVPTRQGYGWPPGGGGTARGRGRHPELQGRRHALLERAVPGADL
ncbi:MAG: FG-GAP repeat domain-containing protein, partial [Rhizobacter sp.]